MSSLLTELGSAAANLPAEAVAFALGIAAGRALEAPGTEIGQKTWAALPIKAVDPETAGAIVAENVQQLAWGENEAAQYGINPERFDAIVNEILEAPGFGELMRMLRRGTITPDDLTHGLRKLKMETRWDAALTDLQSERIDPAVVATAIQRGIVTDPGYLPVALDFGGADVPEPAHSGLDAVKEAAAAGIDTDRLALLTRIVGLPPSPGELLQLLNRGTINEASFRMGIAEGNTRNEWATFLMQLKRRLLTPREYAEAELRGILARADAQSGAGLSGLEPADYVTLFETVGRPLPVHAITTGLARGGTFGGTYADVPEPYQDAIRRSNIRPEYAVLAHANRYNYPSAFVLRSLTQAGEISGDEAHQILLNIGWEPTLAEKVAATWAGGTGAKADAHVAKAETQLWNTIHKSYVEDESDQAKATEALGKVGVAAGSIGAVLALWDEERSIVRAQLTAAQIKKAIGQPGKDKAWATERLLERGYSADDAATFLAE